MTDISTIERTSYLARIERVQNHIYAHLDGALDLDVLADVAAMSRFHWHRVYRAMTGETAAQTVRRLRLARAATALAHTGEPIETIASQAGYTSQAAFSRAFSAAYGQPPANFRDTGPHAALKAAQRHKDDKAYPVEIRRIDAFTALGLVHPGDYMDIDQTFGRLFNGLERSGMADRVRGVLAAYTDDPEAVAVEDLRSRACVRLDADASDESAAAQAQRYPLGGGTYAVLAYKGPYSSMKWAYEWLFGTWLPASGREARDGPVLEFYLNMPDVTPPPELLTEICLPLEG